MCKIYIVNATNPMIACVCLKIGHWTGMGEDDAETPKKKAEKSREEKSPELNWLEVPTVVPGKRGSSHNSGKKGQRGATRGMMLPGTLSDRWALYEWKPATREEATISALAWWQQHEHLHPSVAVCARRILCLQASSAASERSFSRGGLIVSKKRQCLSGESVDGLSLVGWHYDDEGRQREEGGQGDKKRTKRVC